MELVGKWLVHTRIAQHRSSEGNPYQSYSRAQIRSDIHQRSVFQYILSFLINTH